LLLRRLPAQGELAARQRTAAGAPSGEALRGVREHVRAEAIDGAHLQQPLPAAPLSRPPPGESTAMSRIGDMHASYN
jgi:hypothetical protein